MAKQNLQRRNIIDPAVADLLSGMERRDTESHLPTKERKKVIKERNKIQSRKENRVTYDLPPNLRQAIKETAEKEGIPASQMVTLALYQFMDQYAKKEIDLGQYKEMSKSPRYDWNLVIPEKEIPKFLK
jgi:predicted DNA binding CopG/RHH family protein